MTDESGTSGSAAETPPTETTQTPPSGTESTEPKSLINDEGKPAEPAAPAEPLTVEQITMPEGFTAPEGSMEKFIGIMNNAELSPSDRANALVGLQAEVFKQASDASSAAWDKLQGEWKDAVRADPEVGGAKLEATVSSIGKLIDQYGNADTRTAFNVTGAGNNPAVIKFLAKVAEQLTEGSHVQGTRGEAAPRTEADLARSLYPSMQN